MRKIVLLIFILSILFVAVTPVYAGGPLNVYYAGPRDQIPKILNLGGYFTQGKFALTFVDDPAQASIYVLNGTIPSDPVIAERIQSGAAGLVLYMGRDITSEQIKNLLGDQNISLEQTSLPVKMVSGTDSSELLPLEIDWRNGPQVGDRSILKGSTLSPLVSGEDGSLILGAKKLSSGRSIYVFTPFSGQGNQPLQAWKFYDFLIYNLARLAANRGWVNLSEFSDVPSPDTIPLYYAGSDDAVRTALTLAPKGTFIFVDDPYEANLFVLNGVIPDPIKIALCVQDGAGLVLIPGPKTSQDDIETILGFPVTLTRKTDPVSLTALAGISDPLVTEIIWNGAPQVRERLEMVTPMSSVQPLVTAYEDGSWILWQARANIYVFNAFLSGGANPQIQEWAYFNYLVYHLTARAAGQTPLTFADYPASPVPHAAERNLLLALMGLMLVTTFAAFFFVRRYSLAHPEELDKIVADHARFATQEEGTQWENVGFHRPLGGFLVALSIGLVLFIPLIIYQNLILPVFILPSAQALGIWGRVTQFFNIAWLFFDMGTSIAFIKFLSEYRVRDPKKGIQYGQVFVWWQALSGAVQVALVIGLASTFAPRSAYALYAWSIIIHALIQIPGFYQVFRHALTGFQRLDYSRLLDIAKEVIMPMAIQPIFVSLMFIWGKSHPMYGGALGGLFGLGIAAYAAELLTFGIGWWLYRRVGYNVRVLFLAHFDWEVVKTSFKFGVFEMLGSAAWSFGQAAEIAITQARLINYAEIWGNWGMAQNFIFAFNVTQTLNDGVMPAISEAISNGKKLLSQYYTVMAYKYNGMVSAFLAAVLLAVAPKFIIGASGVEFQRAAVYVIPLIIWGAIQFPSWVGDNVQLGSNKPYLKSILVFSEQVIRVVFAWILLERFQVTALIIAYFIGLFFKGIAAYIINHKVCYPQRFFVWQSLVAPLLAGATHYGILWLMTSAIWSGDQITSVLIFLIGILPSFPLYMFFYGFFGGWDKATLDELNDAVALTGAMRWLTHWGMYAPTAFGAKISPLNGRFPISIRAAAMREAEELTREKVKL